MLIKFYSLNRDTFRGVDHKVTPFSISYSYLALYLSIIYMCLNSME